MVSDHSFLAVCAASLTDRSVCYLLQRFSPVAVIVLAQVYRRLDCVAGLH